MKFPVMALAAAISTALPVSASADSWQGLYAGGQVGYASVKDEGVEFFAGSRDGYTESSTIDSYSFGLHVGYSVRPQEALVVAAEAEYNRNEGKAESFQRNNGVVDPAYPITSQLDATFALRGKVGFLLNEQSLLFATAGLASARYSRGWYDVPKDTSNDDWQEGLVVGVGYEYACSARLNGVVEYRYADYGDETVDSVAYGPSYSQNMSLKSNGLVMGLSYRF